MDGNNEEITAFVEQVIQMRKIQKEFFRTRNYTTMQKAKMLEKDVDDRARKLLSQLKKEESEKQDAAQPDLFGDEANGRI